MLPTAATQPPPAEQDSVAADPAATRDDAIGRQIDGLLEQLDASAKDAAGSIGDSADADATSATNHASLDASVDAAIEEARHTPPRSNPAATVENLDDVLAAEAEARMREHDAAGARPESIGPAESRDETGVLTDPAQELEPDPAPLPDPAPVVVPVVVSAPPEPPESAALASSAATDRAQFGHVSSADRTGLSHALGAFLAWPMRMFPPAVRDLIGWLALVTLFNGACVWIYLLI